MYELASVLSVGTEAAGRVVGQVGQGARGDTGSLLLIYAVVINVLVVILWWATKRWVGKVDRWKDDADKRGGFVTRQQYFEWCKPQQDKCREGLICRTEDIEKWRDTIMDKGGAVTFQEHLAGCEKVGEKSASAFAKRIDELMSHHREWVEGQLQLMSERLEKRFLEGFGQLRKEVEMDRKAGSSPGR